MRACPPGMDKKTLRDDLAGLALQGSLAADVNGNGFDEGRLAAFCYRMADAMLKARSL